MQYTILAKSDKFGLRVKLMIDGKANWLYIVKELYVQVLKGDALSDIEVKGTDPTITSATIHKKQELMRQAVEALHPEQPIVTQPTPSSLPLDREHIIVRQTIWKILGENCAKGQLLAQTESFYKIAREMEQEFWKNG